MDHSFDWTLKGQCLCCELILNQCFLLSHGAEMNRHHYSLYVHNCRLILLLRQEPSEAENYKPAEFHWKLDQVSASLSTLSSTPLICPDEVPTHQRGRYFSTFIWRWLARLLHHWFTHYCFPLRTPQNKKIHSNELIGLVLGKKNNAVKLSKDS